MSVEDMERDLKELAKRFMNEDLVLSEAIDELRGRYSKEVRRQFSERNPPSPEFSQMFGRLLSFTGGLIDGKNVSRN